MKEKVYSIADRGIGIRVETGDGLITRIGLSGKKRASGVTAGMPFWMNQFRSYLNGQQVKWALPLSFVSLTPFQKKVFYELMNVPYGKTVTYQELAVRVKNRNYSRAVAMALSANPFPIVIPCHRVVAKNGLGGFSCGVGVKKILLDLESAGGAGQNKSEKSNPI